MDERKERHRAFHVMAKPMGPLCNLNCEYCFYLEKSHLFPAGKNFKMSEEVLENFIRQHITQQDIPEISFAWQGGEPTLAGLDYFRRIVALQEKHAGGKRITNALQTNGTLLDDEWGEFLASKEFLVGISLDGPPKLHDAFRRDRNGGGTYARVLEGLLVLKKHRVEFNTLTVVNRKNASRPRETYRFLRDLGSGFIQFIPLVERVPDAKAKAWGLKFAAPSAGTESARVTEASVEPRQYGAFLCEVFDEWKQRDVGRAYVQMFDVTLGNWVNAGAGLCVFSETCGAAMALEHSGDVYSCDHYVYPDYRLGDIRERSLREMVNSGEQQAFGSAKKESLPAYCRECSFLRLCHGGCPKHRFIATPDGEPGLNYLCAGYRRFFAHSAPVFKQMARRLQGQGTLSE